MRVYFEESETPTAADTTTVPAVWIERIDSEYREMPGLRLSLSQAARLWGLPAAQCRALLVALVERGRLAETPDGLYRAVGDRLRARPELAGTSFAS